MDAIMRELERVRLAAVWRYEDVRAIGFPTDEDATSGEENGQTPRIAPRQRQSVKELLVYPASLG